MIVPGKFSFLDRMLIAQAQAENLPINSNEILFESYGVRRIWGRTGSALRGREHW